MELILYRLTIPAPGGMQYGLRILDEQGHEKQRMIGHKVGLLRHVWETAQEGVTVYFHIDPKLLGRN
jgi:hypothetical protein